MQEDIDFAQEEEVILQTMKKLHSDRFNIVRLYESFFYKEHYCLVFELLDMDLHKFRQISPGQHLQLKQIRPILQQLAASLVFLNSAGIIHADLKPDNIMLVDRVRQPLKLIDFGVAFDDPEKMTGVTIQTLWYRSPEILYDEPFSGAIDVWSLGCIAAELSMGTPLFRANDEEDLMRQIAFAIRDPQHEGNLLPHAIWPRYWMEGRFMNSPASITMSHLQGSYKNRLYVKSCEDLMDICRDQSSDDGGHGDQVILQMSLNEDSSSSSASPAKEGSKVNAKSGNRPEDSQATVRRSERLAAARRGTSGTTGPNRPKTPKPWSEGVNDWQPLEKVRVGKRVRTVARE
ncbi:unnamed protein product [Pleuronectes platessa]|uniref:Protein kinase domain-containing protein n=1 Tax=Pleuronectes platessa TaxID=8262 RepID=A0A9N7TVR8_PLEPL|nr:unnamed protein product [Pleuronectes platessa]